MIHPDTHPALNSSSSVRNERHFRLLPIWEAKRMKSSMINDPTCPRKDRSSKLEESDPHAETARHLCAVLIQEALETWLVSASAKKLSTLRNVRRIARLHATQSHDWKFCVLISSLQRKGSAGNALPRCSKIFLLSQPSKPRPSPPSSSPTTASNLQELPLPC